MKELLFDISPEETEKSKKTRKRKPDQEPVFAHRSEQVFPTEVRFLASINGHITCPDCGIGIVDLVEERNLGGKIQWLVQCGWNCLTSWLVDPIPGILDTEDAKQASRDEFVIRGGRFEGMTFSQMDAAGHRIHIQALAAKGRPYVATAASEWLAKNGG